MRRNWYIAAIVLGIVAIALAALASRLKEDDGQLSPTEWAGSVCSSLSDWRSSIVALADVQPGELDADTLSEKLDDAETATEQLVSELDDLGAPDLESGEQVQQQLEASVDDLQSDFESLKSDAQAALDADSSAEFLQALAPLAPQFQALLDDVSQVLDEVQSSNVADEVRSELQQAFADAESCQELQAEVE
jgi:gas vesicle protein